MMSAQKLRERPVWMQYLYYVATAFRPIRFSTWQRLGAPNPFVQTRRRREVSENEIRDFLVSCLPARQRGTGGGFRPFEQGIASGCWE